MSQENSFPEEVSDNTFDCFLDDFSDLLTEEGRTEETEELIFSCKNTPRLQRILEEKGEVTWGDVYAEALEQKDKYLNDNEGISPELWEIFHTDPSTKMICIVEDDGEYWLRDWTQAESNEKRRQKTQEEIIREANTPLVHACVIGGLLLFIVAIIAFSIWIAS